MNHDRSDEERDAEHLQHIIERQGHQSAPGASIDCMRMERQREHGLKSTDCDEQGLAFVRCAAPTDRPARWRAT